MVLDLLRFGYDSRWQMWQDDPTLTDGYWFRAADTATWYEKPTYFRSSVWDGEFDCNFPVGEVPLNPVWNVGANEVGYLGVDHCGSDSAMSFGGVHGVDPPIVTLSDGSADCCRIVNQSMRVVGGSVPAVRQFWLARALGGSAAPAVQTRGHQQSAVVVGGGLVPAVQTRGLHQLAVVVGGGLVPAVQTRGLHQLAVVVGGSSIPAVQARGYFQQALVVGGSSAPAVQGDDVPIIGEIRLFAFNYLDSRWLECDGGAVSQTTYAALYALLGSTYGTPGGGLFVLPNFQRQVPMGRGGSQIKGPANTIGSQGGQESITLAASESGVDTHTHDAPTAGSFLVIGAAIGVPNIIAPNVTSSPTTAGVTGGARGATTAHNNVQPSLVIKYMIFSG